uniref:Uncharacterized protein n=1 Tax=Oryza sativa subsp. japonica TaxID=39947 RepID=Q8H5C7_ORYSJ|nr:hypothetical protein [Oryza sativa Japonica Group]BAD31470.1 hypothetical protein [Oryza sativa Japonica Group]
MREKQRKMTVLPLSSSPSRSCRTWRIASSSRRVGRATGERSTRDSRERDRRRLSSTHRHLVPAASPSEEESSSSPSLSLFCCRPPRRRAPPITNELSPFLSNSCSIIFSPCRSNLALTTSRFVQPIDGNAVVPTRALERALCTAAATSSPFPLIWTKPGQAVAPASPPHPPLYLPSRTPKNGAPEKEITPLLHRRRSEPAAIAMVDSAFSGEQW